MQFSGYSFETDLARHSQAAYNFGRDCEQDYTTALSWYHRAVGAGDTNSKFKIQNSKLRNPYFTRVSGF